MNNQPGWSHAGVQITHLAAVLVCDNQREFYSALADIFNDPATCNILSMRYTYQAWSGLDACYSHLVVVCMFNVNGTPMGGSAFGAHILIVIATAAGVFYGE
jgi:hypothetical protein